MKSSSAAVHSTLRPQTTACAGGSVQPGARHARSLSASGISGHGNIDYATTSQSHHHLQQPHQQQQQQQQQHRSKHSSKTTSIPRPHSDWQIPERYEIRHLIGTGSYGHVCEAFDRVEKRVVAIKKIHRVFEDLIDCKRILREIAILNRLNHDNVVKVLDLVVPQDVQKFDELYVVLEIADSDFKKLFRDFGLARTVDLPEDRNPKLPTSPREQEQAPEVMGVPYTKNLKRQLTGHVVTRWYRAPELILLQENYTEAIDTWSIGCIFAELLNMMKENVPYHSDRGPLFPGSSCFPLSPDQKHATDYKFHTRGNRDQLNMIFNVLGTPSDEDIESLEKDDAKRYIRIFHPREGINLQLRFPSASSDALDLLKSMLVFNPNKRVLIDDALAHPLFRDIRNLNVETTADDRVRLPFDDWQNLDEPQLRNAFLKEIQRYHSELKIPQVSQGPTLKPPQKL